MGNKASNASGSTLKTLPFETMESNRTTSLIGAATAAAAAGTAIACAAGVKTSVPSRRLQCKRAKEVMQHADSRTVHRLCIYECQRWLPVSDWDSQNLHFYERAPLCHEDGEGAYEQDPETGAPLIDLPNGWAWCDKWRQRGGWEYSFNFFSSWSSEVKWFCKVRRRKWTRTVCLEIADTVAVAPESANTLCISGSAQPDKQEAPPPVKVFVSPWKGHSQGQRSANSTRAALEVHSPPSPTALTPRSRRRANTWSPGPSSPSPFPAAAVVRPTAAVIEPNFPEAAVIQLPQLPKAAIAISPAPAEAEASVSEPAVSRSAPASSSMVVDDLEFSLYL